MTVAIRRVNVPLLAPEAIIPYLGAPHHWREGRSAKSLIDQWWMANDLPGSVRRLLDQAPEWQNSELVDAFAERSTDLSDGRASHSQSDMFAIVGVGNKLGILIVEAKVDEGFDKLVDQWRADGSAGKQTRLAKLGNLLGLKSETVGGLRYQLLHRTASTIIEAKRYRASQAAMIVQSWSPSLHGHDDFLTFVDALGLAKVKPGELTGPKMVDGVSLRLGWSSECS